MKSRISVASAVIAVLCCGPANAEMWNGPYLGLYAGAAVPSADILFGSKVDFDEPISAVYGAQLGYNHSFDNILIGAELNLGGFGGGIEGDTGVVVGCCSGDTDYDISWTGEARGRVGLLITPDTALFAAAGLSLASVEVFEHGPPQVSAGEGNLLGYNVGLGIEHALSGSISARLEYVYTDYGKETFSGKGGFIDQTVDLSSQQVRASVNFHF